MITYRDMTFCNNKECKKTNCPRMLTDEIIKQANEFGLPYLSVADFDCEDKGL